jgi:hypothetical protein
MRTPHINLFLNNNSSIVLLRFFFHGVFKKVGQLDDEDTHNPAPLFFITTIPFILTALRKGNNIRCNRLVETTAFVLFVTVFSNVL